MGNTKKRALLLVFMISLVVASFAYAQKVVRADSPSIIINELMYNPASGVDNDEFLEIHNTTENTVDLTNWCFTAGITLCFSPGASIAAGAYAVISPNAARTLATYGVSTIGTYTGKLDNGGETVTLRDNNANIINSVTYDDTPPWPTSPDGTGPSLALKDPTKDNSLAASWAACPCGSSPGVVNLIFTAGLPDILNLSTPQNVTSSASPTITVDVSNTSSVNLLYKVMFGPEQTLPMYDDGAHGDGAASDGTYGATLPAQDAGSLVRYKVSATNNNGTQTKPGGSDTINYQGYVVQDPSVTSQIPILQWFMEDADRDEMIANHSFDDQEFPAVIAYGNTVIDNAKVHIKGGVKRNFIKKSFAFDLPKGYKLRIDNEMTRAVDEFHLDADYLDPSGTIVTANWQVAKESGLDTQQVFKVRLQNNADFYGVYTFLEEDDKQWRQVFGYENMSYFGTDNVKGDVPIDHTYEWALYQDALAVPRSAARRQYALDNLDVPNTVNYMAFMAIIHNCEWHNGKNMIKVHDVLGTGRWKALAHDLDCSMQSSSAIDRIMNPFDVAPGSFSYTDRFQFDALYEEQDFRQGYYRRLRTLIDEFYSDDHYLDIINGIYQKISPDIQLDTQRWDTGGGGHDAPGQALASITKQYLKTKKDLLVRFRYNNVIPSTQSENPTISIEEIATAGGGDHQTDYIKLKNNTNEVIDVSGWYIPELDFTIPPGAAMAPAQEAFIPRNDTTFKLSHSGSYVLGQLTQDIPLLSGINLYRANNTISDSGDAMQGG